jgi:hypothetical protein
MAKIQKRKLGGDEMRFHPAERDLCIAKSMMKSDVDWFLSFKAFAVWTDGSLLIVFALMFARSADEVPPQKPPWQLAFYFEQPAG